MFKGEEVIVEYREKTGANGYKEPSYETTERVVSGVLVAVGATADMSDGSRPEGATVAYTLYWPRSFTDRLRGLRVKVRGEWFEVVGDPRPWVVPPPPTGFHMVSEVTATYG